MKNQGKIKRTLLPIMTLCPHCGTKLQQDYRKRVVYQGKTVGNESKKAATVSCPSCNRTYEGVLNNR